MSVFGDYAKYYDLLYRDKDYEGEAKFVHTLLERHASGSRSVIELGSGTGRHAALLAEHGYEIFGVERSTEMLDQAQALCSSLPKEIGGRLQFIQGDIRDLRLSQQFDAAISLFHVISYQTAEEDLRAAFKTASEHLKPGGVFIFDCWYGPTVLSDPPRIVVRHLEDDDIFVTRVAEPEMHPEKNIVIVNYTMFVEEKSSGSIQKITECHPMRYLFTPEVKRLAHDAGMEVLASEEWMTNRKPGLDTFSVYFAARKKV